MGKKATSAQRFFGGRMSQGWGGCGLVRMAVYATPPWLSGVKKRGGVQYPLLSDTLNGSIALFYKIIPNGFTENRPK